MTLTEKKGGDKKRFFEWNQWIFGESNAYLKGRKMKKFLVMLLSIVFLLGMAGVATAVPVEFLNVNPEQNVSIYDAWWNGGKSVTAETGVYNITINGTPYASYCIDLQDESVPSILNDYTFTDLASAPDATAGPMDGTKAEWIEKLWAMNYTNSLTGADAAAEMQLAIWEIVADASWDLRSGQFYVNAGYDSLVAGTNTLLENLKNYTGPFASLMAVSSPTGQDYIAPVPEPATMLLLGMGLVGLAGLGRKRFFKI